jgi:hypothetical protein
MRRSSETKLPGELLIEIISATVKISAEQCGRRAELLYAHVVIGNMRRVLNFKGREADDLHIQILAGTHPMKLKYVPLRESEVRGELIHQMPLHRRSAPEANVAELCQKLATLV